MRQLSGGLLLFHTTQRALNHQQEELLSIGFILMKPCEKVSAEMATLAIFTLQ